MPPPFLVRTLGLIGLSGAVAGLLTPAGEHAERYQIFTCDSSVDHFLVLKLLSLRLPFVQVFAHADSDSKHANSVCQATVCNPCTFVVVQSAHFDVDSDRQLYPVLDSPHKLPDYLYPLLQADLDLISHIDSDAKIYFTGEYRVEKLIGELKAHSSVAVTSILGDTIVVRSTDGVEMLRYLVDQRKDVVEIVHDVEPCDRLNALGGAWVCLKPKLDGQRRGPGVPGANLPVAPEYTTGVPEYVSQAPDASMRAMRVSDWKERQHVKLTQLREGKRYTDVGFKVVRLRPGVWESVAAIYEIMIPEKVIERWPAESALLNHWESWSYKIFTSISLAPLLSVALKREVEAWVGLEVEVAAVLDTRRYTNGSLIGYHVDQMKKHLFTAIINVDQEVQEPWPLEIFDHSGKRHEIILKPGDMALLESSVCVHGRMTKLHGKQYSNMFAHFRLPKTR